jgi:N-glycosylase/DNA lyase
MSFVELPAEEFDLRLTLESGQVFHWSRDGDGWRGLIGRVPVYVEQRGPELRVTAGRERMAARYLSLDHPLERIYASFPDDAFSRAALAGCRGLRIIRQPRWECLATFITSAMKQVAHIRQMSLALRRRFGVRVGEDLWAYPEPEALAGSTERSLRACGLGFRAGNLLRTARMVAAGEMDLDAAEKMETEEAIETLCRLPGVGRKVANCVLLFAYERLDAVPIDVWIGRVLRAIHGPRRATVRELEGLSRERLGIYAGYVQQYWFHHARVSKSLPAG